MAEHRVVKGPNWECVTKAAAWQPRDSVGEVVFDDHLWILGGWFDRDIPNPRDVWKSRNGKDWTCVQKTAPWEHSDIPIVFDFNNRLWMMGGRKLPGKENSNKVWSSPDGVNWDLVSDAAGWCPRLGAGYVVFKNKMWVLGGTENFYDGNDQTLHNDVWCSENGKDWTLVLEHAPWSKRSFHQSVVFDGKIWVVSGGSWRPTNDVTRDVWCSEDGVNWTRVTDDAPWAGRIWFTLVVYRGCMWMLGGWTLTNGNFGDVWYSRDGKEWVKMESDVIWKTRHEPSGLVKDDKIWILGGHADPLDSEVWTLSLPRDWNGK